MLTNVGPGETPQAPEQRPIFSATILEKFANRNSVAERTLNAVDPHVAMPAKKPPSEKEIKTLMGKLEDIGLRSGELEGAAVLPAASAFTHQAYGHLAAGTTKVKEAVINEFAEHHGLLHDEVLKLQAAILIN